MDPQNTLTTELSPEDRAWYAALIDNSIKEFGPKKAARQASDVVSKLVALGDERAARIQKEMTVAGVREVIEELFDKEVAAGRMVKEGGTYRAL